jgi:hypothetical protein
VACGGRDGGVAATGRGRNAPGAMKCVACANQTQQSTVTGVGSAGLDSSAQ